MGSKAKRLMKNLKNFKEFELSKAQQMSVNGGQQPGDCSVGGTSCQVSCQIVWKCNNYSCNGTSNQCTCSDCPGENF
jgi:hypothetical protein